MKFDEKAAARLMTDLGQAAFAMAFLTGWVICCVIVALLLRIDTSVAANLPSNKELLGNESLEVGGFIRCHYEKQLMRSKSFLTQIPETLGN